MITSATHPVTVTEDAPTVGVSQCNLMVKGAFEAALSFSSFLLKVLDPLFHGGGAEKPVPSMIYPVPRHPRAFSREGQGDVEKILVPSP